MQIDPNVNIAALTRLADKTGEVQAQVGVSVLKEVMETAESQTLQMLQSMQPHLGQNVDVRV
ncbi:MAG: YjfB family protein [Chloroflexi bacterium]|nr:YjfB family protein [Chloroflexota bacterium]